MNEFKQLKQLLMNFSKLSEENWTEVEKNFTPLTLEEGDTFICQGETASRIAFISKGGVRMFYTLKDGREFIKAFNFENSLIASYSALLTNKPSTHTICALEKTELLVAKYSDVQKLYKKDIIFQELGRKIAELEFLEKEKREYEFLMLNATQRFEQFKLDFPFWHERIPKGYIASYLGINPSTLSRMK